MRSLSMSHVILTTPSSEKHVGNFSFRPKKYECCGSGALEEMLEVQYSYNIGVMYLYM